MVFVISLQPTKLDEQLFMELCTAHPLVRTVALVTRLSLPLVIPFSGALSSLCVCVGCTLQSFFLPSTHPPYYLPSNLHHQHPLLLSSTPTLIYLFPFLSLSQNGRQRPRRFATRHFFSAFVCQRLWFLRFNLHNEHVFQMLP